MWSSAVAWQVTAFMATQATTFYLLVTWLPTIEVSRGVSPGIAGWHLFLYQLVGIPAGLVVTVFMRGRADHRLVGVAVSIPVVLGAAGLLLAPSWLLVWVVLAGLGGGSSLVVALALVGERVRSAGHTAQLSGMVQSIGYLLAVAGPLGAGLLFRLTAGWSATLVAVGAVAALQLVVALFVGRPRFTHPSDTRAVP
jgi:CP family cyanate transporter-like MFS transporter